MLKRLLFLAQVGALAQFPEYDLIIRFISKAGEGKSKSLSIEKQEIVVECIKKFFYE